MVSKRRAEQKRKMKEATGGFYWLGTFRTKEEAKLKTIPFKGRDLQAFKVVKDPRFKSGWLSLFNIKR